MGRTVCHLDGKFFELSSVVESPVTDLMSEAEYRKYSEISYGELYMNDPGETGFEARIKRARERGHSSLHPADVGLDLEEFLKHEMCVHYGTPYEREPGNWDTKVDKWPGLEEFKKEWFSDSDEPVVQLKDLNREGHDAA